MSIVKETASGEHYLEKIKTEADDPNISGLQLYQRNVGSDGASGNTVFTLTSPYSPGSNTLFVYLNGQKCTLEAVPSTTTEYEETDPYTVTFGASLLAADVVEFIVVGAYPLDADEAAEILGIITGTKMYFYQAAAPLGWTIDTTLGDAVLAVHGSSSYYGSTGGGEQRGTWTQPDHNHKWYDYISTTGSVNADSFDAAGASIDMSATYPTTVLSGGIVVGVTAANPTTVEGDFWTDNNASPDTWRPFANVGIIATRD